MLLIFLGKRTGPEIHLPTRRGFNDLILPFVSLILLLRVTTLLGQVISNLLPLWSWIDSSSPLNGRSFSPSLLLELSPVSFQTIFLENTIFQSWLILETPIHVPFYSDLRTCGYLN